ncbi:sugar transferase [Lactobacillus gallinarum]|uniref:sugar transferase n=1 Tax=Lactobacillus gallinarum TaxID=52242 RepID=UPI00174CD5CF|nr:sugar transferase [Lactobacillus gallinarum]MBM6973528.1 sugar transferase [Lactobacillus gallinarum]
MTVHITDLHGMAYFSVAQIAQNMVTKIATNELNFDPFTIYFYSWPDEPGDVISARFDGIIAALQDGDTVIVQSPSWNTIEWDQKFFDRISIYHNIKKIIFVEDIPPLMFESNKYMLPQYIDYYNKADVLILASRKLYDYLRVHGLKPKKYVIQHMWDHISQVNPYIIPKNNKVINFAGDPKKFDFVKDWKSDKVKLNVYSEPLEGVNNPNITFTHWQDDPVLINSLRQAGGFGLVWSEEPYWLKYMKLNASYKLSTYLAAGIPLIVNSDSPEKDTIVNKHLGIIADSIDEAVEKVEKMSDMQYNQMKDSIDQFAKLIRGGYFTKRALIEAVFKAQYE